MTQHLSFEVYGDPKPQPRPRAFARRMGSKFVARVYNPDSADHWKAQIAAAIRAAKWEPFVGPVRVEMAFFFARPKSHLNSKGALKPSAPLFHTARPDVDNIAKAVADQLTASGVWSDDSTIVELKVSKDYVTSGKPGCNVMIDSIG